MKRGKSSNEESKGRKGDRIHSFHLASSSSFLIFISFFSIKNEINRRTILGLFFFIYYRKY